MGMSTGLRGAVEGSEGRCKYVSKITHGLFITISLIV